MIVPQNTEIQINGAGSTRRGKAMHSVPESMTGGKNIQWTKAVRSINSAGITGQIHIKE